MTFPLLWGRCKCRRVGFCYLTSHVNISNSKKNEILKYSDKEATIQMSFDHLPSANKSPSLHKQNNMASWVCGLSRRYTMSNGAEKRIPSPRTLKVAEKIGVAVPPDKIATAQTLAEKRRLYSFFPSTTDRRPVQSSTKPKNGNSNPKAKHHCSDAHLSADKKSKIIDFLKGKPKLAH